MYDTLGEVSSRVENVNREIVFEQAYKRLKAQFLDQGIAPEVAERWAVGDATQQGIEVLNFSRHGSNPYVRLLSVALPFTNAKLQGLKKLGTVATGTGMGVLTPRKGFNKTDIALKKLGNAVLARAFTIMSASVLYELMAMNDDDRDDIPWYRQDSNWLIPTPLEDKAGGTVYANIATPFEAGTLFKLIPSLITRSLVNGQWGKNETRSVWHAISQTLGLDPLGMQFAKPIVEWQTNHNRFRDSPIVPFYMEKMDPEYQYTDYTSAPAKAMGELTGFSPMKMDNSIKTAFGTFGQYALQLTDWVMRMGMDDERYPERSPRDWTDQPFIKDMLTDTMGGGMKQQFFEMADESSGAIALVNRLMKTEPREAAKYISENRELTNPRLRDIINGVRKKLRDIRRTRTQVLYSGMSESQKSDAERRLNQQELAALRVLPIIEQALGR
jgi:hypothetical protein